MKINLRNNSFNFGARIKIDKNNLENIRDASLLSSTGSSLSGIGISSSVPLTDPVHHIHTMGKVVDGSFAFSGVSIAGYGLKYFKQATEIIFKNKKM